MCIRDSIQPVLVFLGNLVLEEGGQEQNRADGRIPGVVHLAAVGGSVLGVLIPVSYTHLDVYKRQDVLLNDMEEKELIVMEATAQGLKKARETAE